jgi:NADP-dependent 3-hydroxy acid dehydrogenase YdfG
MAKVWFITGISKGFRRIWATAALERGDQVAATARDTGTLAELVERFGDSVLPLELDVRPLDVIRAEYANRIATWERWNDLSVEAHR